MTREEFIQQHVLNHIGSALTPAFLIAEADSAYTDICNSTQPKEPKPLFENIL
jgi:hypothetical protein